ncbi:MarR family transcriptional regulator [Reichenbachiella carrageenanivorans]|uniref:MarR family transcriptional regulator n=1 Tax=Reichenbachiella carrageenanivorans TaxID=2979869 RepID=A0ABY6D4M3_9BACT|nr:MarR family transcriptional regulator [Reichenbachiella carrageenanivorans]UXX80008.1 MarR family transcriptional regulator [Reichenbachiella carrageenanivorans]
MKFEEEIKQSSFKNAREKAVINILYTGNWLRDHSEKVLKPNGINEQHFNILRILRGRHPLTICPGEIKEVLINKRGDLTRLLDKLVANGMVERDINPDNRRMINLKITDKGLGLLAKLDSVMEEQSQTYNALTEEESNLLSDLLDKLRG